MDIIIKKLKQDVEFYNKAGEKDRKLLTTGVPLSLIECLVDKADNFYELLNDSLNEHLKSGKNNDDIITHYADTPYLNTVVNYVIEKYKKQLPLIIDIAECSTQECPTQECPTPDLQPVIDTEEFELRKCQKQALQAFNVIGLQSGLFDLIMGAGKSCLIMVIINELFKAYKGAPKLFIILCKRKEILEQMILTDVAKKEWKRKKIINLDNFDIIDYVTNKPKQTEFDTSLKLSRPTIMVVNTDFFRSRASSYNITQKNTHVIIMDECHDVSGTNIYDKLADIKYNSKINIIGFSATPLRAKAEEKLVNIFSNTFNREKTNKKLNVIYTYNLIDAIKDDVVLPFKFKYIQVQKSSNNAIGKINKDIVKKIITNMLPELPYKKIIAWTNTIEHMVEFYKFFEKEFPQLTVYCSSSKDKYYSKLRTNVEEFKTLTGKAILICVNRHREGSDIPVLDCGIYLDAVEKRSLLVALQTSGRTIRPDKDGKKIRGNVLDMFINEDETNATIMTIQRIADYYREIANLTVDGADTSSMLEMIDNSTINSKTDTIKIHVDNQKKHDIHIQIKLIDNTIDWGHLKNDVKKHILTQDSKDSLDALRKEYAYDVSVNKKYGISDKKKYFTIASDDNLKLDLKLDPKEYYALVWENWYDFLGVDVSIFPKNKAEWVKKVQTYSINTYKVYRRRCTKLNLPTMPQELYRDYKNWNTAFKCNDIF